MGSELIIMSAPNDGAVVSIELSLDELIPTDADNADDIKIKN